MATIQIQGTDSSGGAQNILANVLGSGGLYGMATTPYVNTGLLWVPQKAASDGSLVAGYPAATRAWAQDLVAVTGGTDYLLGPFATAAAPIIDLHFYTVPAGTLYVEWCKDATWAYVVIDVALTTVLAASANLVLKGIRSAGSYGRLRFRPTTSGNVGGEVLLRAS